MTIELSQIDAQRFGVPSARGQASEVSELPGILRFCSEQAVRFVILRCPVDRLPLIQALEESGFRLMDTLVFYTRSLTDWEIPSIDVAIDIRPVAKGDVDVVQSIAAEALEGYPSHYRADARLDPAASDMAYVDWCVRSCLSKEVADIVLLATIDRVPAGFMTFRVDGKGGGSAVIGGVTKAVRRRGVYRALLVRGLAWLQSEEIKIATLSTQLPNFAVQRVWAQLGFEPDRAMHTFHGWL